ncbi:MAG: hypothetical protein ABIZ09_12590 [Rhodoferax sp.]
MSHTFTFCRRLVAAVSVTCFFTPSTWAADYAYKVNMTLTAPKGSAAEKLATNKPSTTKMTPCIDTLPDQVNITITYDAGKTALERRDLYVILNSPTGTLFPIKKYTLGSSPVIRGPFTPSTLTGSLDDNIYLRSADNLGQGSQTETLFGGYISLESVATGTWQVVSILANSSTVDFEDPATWSAWDVATLIVGKPWAGVSKGSCGPGFAP